MSDVDHELNPFAAPETSLDENIQLAGGDDFLLWRNSILCRERVELPRVCIVSGDTEGLRQRTRRFRTLTGMTTLYIWGAAVLFVLAPSAFALTSRLPNLYFRLITVVGGAICFFGVVVYAWRFGHRDIHVTWYVSQRYLKQDRWKRWGVRLLCTSVAGLLGVVVSEKLATGPGLPMILKFSLVGFLVGLTFPTETRMQFDGSKYGLFCISGQSRAFNAAVHAMNFAKSYK